jgi:GNAT superfamily N-acetyltransferase
MRVYVRRGTHMIERQVTLCLDIANIEVEEECQGQGLFTAWLAYAEQMAELRGLKAVFVENIMNKRLIPFLFRRGYSEQEGDRSCMYKIVPIK